MPELPKYATWIRKKKIIQFWLITLFVNVLGIISGIIITPLYFITILSIPFLYISIIISLSAYRFSKRGDDFQNRIHEVIINSVKRNGDVLDIGCGSGNLIIKIAKNNPGNNIGIDFWGDNWEYSKQQCEKNAQIEQIKNVQFQKASASKLPFETNSISNVVSCLTFMK